MTNSIETLFPSRYLKAHDLENGEEILTIVSVSMESMRNPKGGADVEKPVVTFEGLERGLILNRTNADIISRLFGKNLDDWRGRSVTLYATKVEVAGETYDVIRVRPQVPTEAFA